MSYRPTLYVAGPYTNPDPVINTHGACRFASQVWDDGEFAPVVPHTTLLWHAITPRPLEFWYALDLHLMRRACDAIVRLPGASSGADAEMAEALILGMRVVDFNEFSDAARDAWLNR